jgi:hypothetical protein
MANCIVVVQFDLPKRTEEQAITGGTSTAPIYRGLAKKGLIRKDYLNGETGTGGVYLWDSRQSAEAWFTEERIAELTGHRGAPSPHLVRHTRDRRQSEGRDPRQWQGDRGGGLKIPIAARRSTGPNGLHPRRLKCAH